MTTLTPQATATWTAATPDLDLDRRGAAADRPEPDEVAAELCRRIEARTGRQTGYRIERGVIQIYVL